MRTMSAAQEFGAADLMESNIIVKHKMKVLLTLVLSIHLESNRERLGHQWDDISVSNSPSILWRQVSRLFYSHKH